MTAIRISNSAHHCKQQDGPKNFQACTMFRICIG